MTGLAGEYKERKGKMALPFSPFFFPSLDGVVIPQPSNARQGIWWIIEGGISLGCFGRIIEKRCIFAL
jgi:hypothetical protein